jgi:hypothetical protein
MQSLGKPSESSKLTLVWIPRHQGISGKEEVGRLANEGAVGVPVGQAALIPYIVGKKFIKRCLELEDQARWDGCNGCCQSKMLVRCPLASSANELLQ